MGTLLKTVGEKLFFSFILSQGEIHYVTSTGEIIFFFLLFHHGENFTISQQSGKTICFITGETSLYHNNRGKQSLSTIIFLNGANTNFSTLVHSTVDTNYFLGCGVETRAILASLARRSSCRWAISRLNFLGSLMILLISSILISNSLTLFFNSALARSSDWLFSPVVVSSERLFLPHKGALRWTLLASVLMGNSSVLISFHSTFE